MNKSKIWSYFNPFPNNKIVDLTKLKGFADDKLNVANKMISHFDRVENTVGKEENAGYKHFLLFPFSNAFFFRVVKLFCLFRVLPRINSISVIKQQQFTNPCFHF